MSIRLRYLMRALGILLSLTVFVLAGPAWAQNENEQIGFSSTHIFDGDYFGENVDVLNGNLVLTIPIGPAYKVSAGLDYRLLLAYNSKVWVEKNDVRTGVRNEPLLAGSWELDWEAQTAKQIHNAGLGFRLQLGRIFYAKKHPVLTDGQGEVALDEGWYYQDQNGTSHPIIYCPDLKIQGTTGTRSDPPDPKPVCPFDGGTTHYETVDATYMRAEKIIQAGEHIGWYLYPGDGRKLTFKHHPDPYRSCPTCLTDPKLDTDREDLRGFYLSRIEGIEKYVDNAIVKPYNYVDITYDSSPRQHSILSIDEYRVSPGIQPVAVRTISFANVASLTVPSCNAAGGTLSLAIHGGLVKTVTLPSFSGNRASYDFEYCIDDLSTPPLFSWCDGSCPDSRDHKFMAVPMLKRLVFPATGPSAKREVMEFSYADTSATLTGTYGEMTERRLPTGARIQYQYGNYDYGMSYVSVVGFGRSGSLIKGGRFTDTRQLLRIT